MAGRAAASLDTAEIPRIADDLFPHYQNYHRPLMVNRHRIYEIGALSDSEDEMMEHEVGGWDIHSST